jgi:uncharacterized protein
MIFIDTGAFLARYLPSDQNHEAALAYWNEVSVTSTLCFTSSYVLSELITLLARRTGHHFAAQRGRQLYASQELHVLRSTTDDEAGAIVWLERMAGARIGFVDCISFALMRRSGINDVFGFDSHFQAAGFRLLP